MIAAMIATSFCSSVNFVASLMIYLLFCGLPHPAHFACAAARRHWLRQRALCETQFESLTRCEYSAMFCPDKICQPKLTASSNPPWSSRTLNSVGGDARKGTPLLDAVQASHNLEVLSIPLTISAHSHRFGPNI